MGKKLGIIGRRELITADLLIPGDGQPVRQAAVVMENGLIRYAGPARNAPDTTGRRPRRPPGPCRRGGLDRGGTLLAATCTVIDVLMTARAACLPC
ncbi:hypothetical protein [Nonomuraea roseola]|uniref:Amidohydrolase 3 domain-containing protein n=1 Tax=Nonomuraea roseola TaxID=46179 RepID=A0ABV5Q0Q8_9ACTN